MTTRGLEEKYESEICTYLTMLLLSHNSPVQHFPNSGLSLVRPFLGPVAYKYPKGGLFSGVQIRESSLMHRTKKSNHSWSRISLVQLELDSAFLHIHSSVIDTNTGLAKLATRILVMHMSILCSSYNVSDIISQCNVCCDDPQRGCVCSQPCLTLSVGGMNPWIGSLISCVKRLM